MEKLQLILKFFKEITEEAVHALSPELVEQTTNSDARRILYVMARVFRELTGSLKVKVDSAGTDSMGGIDIKARFDAPPYFLSINYSQELSESWQHIEINTNEKAAHMPKGVDIFWNFDLTHTELLKIQLSGISAAQKKVLSDFFTTVFQEIENLEEQAFPIDKDLPAGTAGERTEVPLSKRLTDFLYVLDKERDGYMEWHDGPSLWEVDSYFSPLSDEEKAEASIQVASRIKEAYNEYLGRAAELLKSRECMDALMSILKKPGNASTIAAIARNLIMMGVYDEALTQLSEIISNADLVWYSKIDALVHLRSIIKDTPEDVNIRNKLSPRFLNVVLEALKDDDYLVRYHAANALLIIAGKKEEISDNRELFSLVCGKQPNDKKPDDEDRKGFILLAEKMKTMLT